MPSTVAQSSCVCARMRSGLKAIASCARYLTVKKLSARFILELLPFFLVFSISFVLLFLIQFFFSYSFPFLSELARCVISTRELFYCKRVVVLFWKLFSSHGAQSCPTKALFLRR